MTSPNRPPGLIQSYREELQVRHDGAGIKKADVEREAEKSK